MTFPKIKWHVELSKELIPHYAIITEISLGSARYREMHSITRQEIDAFRNGGGVLWKIIEKMQRNMLDAWGNATIPERTPEEAFADYLKGCEEMYFQVDN